MAVLTVQRPTAAGTVITYSAASGGGDSFPNSGTETLRVRNQDVSGKTVTVDSPSTCNFGATAAAAHDIVVVVGAGEERVIGPFSTTRFGPSCAISYSAVTSVTVAVESR